MCYTTVTQVKSSRGTLAPQECCDTWAPTEWTNMLAVKAVSEKGGLKLNIQKTKVMASGPITSGEIDGETVETVADFIFLVSKSVQIVIAAMKLKDTCSLEEKL